MKTITRTTLTAFGFLAVGALGLTACSSSSMSGSDSSSSSTAKAMSTSTSMSTSTMDPAANLVGSGCAAYAKAVPSGTGSVSGMAQDPVAVAASNNPLLTTLTKAVSGKLNPKVDLVDTLDSAEYTVFAPVDDAFAKLPAKTVAALSKPKNADTLTSILTYHVIAGQLSPSEIDGKHKTVEGSTVTVKGSGDNITVDGAKVICGGVQTANATVYLLDSVLSPAK
jgi:uncharacterized surface protein with fasciclin (FAS1) repeats